jgi:ADP-ribose pyrophosphatase YjhB (NUDIX family)
VIAICLVRRGAEILVFEGFDRVKGTHYYRPLGGGIEPGERASEAVARELREELATDVTALRQVAVLENIFECDGRGGHEIVFVFEGTLVDRTIYERDAIETSEQDGTRLHVVWRHVDAFDDHHCLVPPGLVPLVRAWQSDDRAALPRA